MKTRTRNAIEDLSRKAIAEFARTNPHPDYLKKKTGTVDEWRRREYETRIYKEDSMLTICNLFSSDRRAKFLGSLETETLEMLCWAMITYETYDAGSTIDRMIGVQRAVLEQTAIRRLFNGWWRRPIGLLCYLLGRYVFSQNKRLKHKLCGKALIDIMEQIERDVMTSG